MNVPTRAQAERYLAEAARLNPGPWVAHSLFVAKAAEAIYRLLPGVVENTFGFKAEQ